MREHADNETTEGRVAPHEDEEISGVPVDRERAAERGRRAGLMGHTDSGDVAEHPAGFLEPGEQVAVFPEAEVELVEEADFVEGLAAEHRSGPREFVIPVRIGASLHPDFPVVDVIDHAGIHPRHCGICLDGGHENIQQVGVDHLRVVVQDKDVVAARFTNPPVAPRRVAHIHLVPDHADPRELLPDRLGRAVGGAVVHQEGLEIRVREMLDGFEAASRVVEAVECRDHDRHAGHGTSSVSDPPWVTAADLARAGGIHRVFATSVTSYKR